MQYTISDKIAPLKPSAIREFFKYAADPSVIALSAGSPAPESLPVEFVQKVMGEIMGENPIQVLSYGQSEGYGPLREAARKYVRDTVDSYKEFDELLVVSGAQQCADLSCKVLCNEGDTIICETPSFSGVLNCFRSYNANLVGVELEDDGISIEGLEKALKENRNVRMIYVIPNCQNPTGLTMSLEKRKAVYQLAKQYGVMVYEDNPYGELRFGGEPLPTIKSMDEEGIVIYAGTLSKILSPGIRVGFLIAPQEIMGRMVVGKQCTDVHTNMLGQLLAHRFLTEYDVETHIKGLRELYRRKCGLMLEEMDKHFPKGVKYTRPDGGLFIWVTLPEGMDGAAFCTQLAEERKVAAVPGGAFAVTPGECVNAFRVNFSTPSEENIRVSIERCGKLLHEWMEKK